MTEFFNRMMENLRKGPLGPVVRWAEAHPRLSAWIVLAVGMVAILVYTARDVGLLPTQWAAVIVATILTAGACVWIISWEDEDEVEGEAAPEQPVKAEASTQAAEAKPAAKKGTGRLPSSKKGTGKLASEKKTAKKSSK